jgi:hypothetical protein
MIRGAVGNVPQKAQNDGAKKLLQSSLHGNRALRWFWGTSGCKDDLGCGREQATESPE